MRVLLFELVIGALLLYGVYMLSWEFIVAGEAVWYIFDWSDVRRTGFIVYIGVMYAIFYTRNWG